MSDEKTTNNFTIRISKKEWAFIQSMKKDWFSNEGIELSTSDIIHTSLFILEKLFTPEERRKYFARGCRKSLK